MEKVIRVNAKIKKAIDWKQEAEYWKAQAQKNTMMVCVRPRLLRS